MATTEPIIIRKMGAIRKKPDMTGKFELDRERLIKWINPTVLSKYIAETAIDNLIKGGEYTITAQDVLEQFRTIPMTLLVPGSKSEEKVKVENIILTYKNN